jgi:hypothetical protein
MDTMQNYWQEAIQLRDKNATRRHKRHEEMRCAVNIAIHGLHNDDHRVHARRGFDHVVAMDWRDRFSVSFTTLLHILYRPMLQTAGDRTDRS